MDFSHESEHQFLETRRIFSGFCEELLVLSIVTFIVFFFAPAIILFLFVTKSVTIPLWGAVLSLVVLCLRGVVAFKLTSKAMGLEK